MVPNAFIGKTKQPTDDELTAALGKARRAWDRLLGEFQKQGLDPEWNSYSLKYGWSLRLKKKARNIVYLGPCLGHFRAAFVLGAKAVTEARKLKAPLGKKYPEGTAVQIEPVKAKDIPMLVKLAAIKLEN